MQLLARVVVTLSIAVLALTWLAPSATAQKAVHHDAAGDVLALTWDEATGTEVTAPAPEVVDGDIRRTVVEHRLRKVILTVRYAELRRAAPVTHFVALETNESIRRTIEVTPDATHPQGKVLFVTRVGRVVRCTGLERRIDYTANTLRLVVPRSCLSAPRWVRAGFGGLRTQPVSGSGQGFIDDGNLEAAFGDSHPEYGVQVLRG